MHEVLPAVAVAGFLPVFPAAAVFACFQPGFRDFAGDALRVAAFDRGAQFKVSADEEVAVQRLKGDTEKNGCFGNRREKPGQNGDT